MLIDSFIKNGHFHETHTIDVAGTPKEVYARIKRLNFGRSRIIRLLFRLRGLPEQALKLKGFIEMGFTVLAEQEGVEIVLGEVGKPWKISSDVQQITVEQFRSFHESGFVKIAWNFHVTPTGSGSRVTTITRVYCTDHTAKWRFGMYWLFIAPFSKWIRRIMLRLLQEDAQMPIK